MIIRASKGGAHSVVARDEERKPGPPRATLHSPELQRVRVGQVLARVRAKREFEAAYHAPPRKLSP
jgi:hypothetical protein